MIRAAAVLLILWTAPAAAVEITLPQNARQTAARNTGPDTFAAPIGVFEDGKVPVRVVEGNVRRSAWRLDSPGLTPFQVMRPLREQLEAAGFDILLDCAADRCGGFDFRFAMETLPGPNMYVNIRDFHVVTAAAAENEVVTVLTSTTATSAYVQIIHAGGNGETKTDPQPQRALSDEGREDETPAAILPDSDDFSADLLARGHRILSDLDFDLGTTALGPGPFTSLEALAAFLRDRPEIRVALVGHTDTVGGLDANIAVSRERALSVRQRLIDSYDIPPAQMDAEGMGYLSPVASNLDPEGRDANRRVEVVLLGLE